MTAAETVDGKARRILAMGWVTIISCDDQHARALVRGEHGDYEATFDHGGWSCTCPAFGPVCSHIYAVRLVTTGRPR